MLAIVSLLLRVKTVDDRDTTRKLMSVPIYCAPEVAAGLMCVCLPEVTPLFKRNLRKELANSRRNGSTTKVISNDEEEGKSGGIYVTSTTTRTYSPMKTPGYIELDEMYHAGVTSAAHEGTPESKKTRA